MKKILYILSLIVPILANSQEFSEFEKTKIKENSLDIIQQYGSYLNLIGDISEPEEYRFLYTKGLIDLFFKEDALVYNDLDPEKKTGKEFEISTYAEYLELWYTSIGLKTEINPDSIKFGKIIQQNGDNFIIRITIDKSISGIYMKSLPNQTTIKFECQIAFHKNNLFNSKFKIVRICLPINELPEKPGTIKGRNLVKQGDIAKYEVLPIKFADSYLWTLPQGAAGKSNTNQIIVEYGNNAESGNIVVKAKNINGTGIESILTVRVEKPLPVDAGKINGKATVKVGEKGQIYVVPEIDNAQWYEWTLPEGATGESTTNHIVVDFSEKCVSGNITVKGRNKAGKGKESILAISVKKPLPGDASSITGKTTVQAGEKGLIYSILQVADAEIYEWTLPPGASGSSSSKMILVNFGKTAISGTITVKAKNKFGYGGSVFLNIIVLPKNQKVSTKKVEISLSAGPNFSSINQSVTNAVIENKTGFIMNLRSNFNITSHLGFTLGIGLSSYKSALKLDNYEVRFPYSDIENDTCEKHVIGENINEQQKIIFVDIPIGLRFKITDKTYVKTYVSIGTIISIPVSKSCTGEGLFSYRGNYLQYGVELYDIYDIYGENKQVYKYVQIDLKPANFSIYASLDIIIPISSFIYFNIGGNFIKGINDLSDFNKNISSISNDVNDYSSLMCLSDKVTVQSYGICLGLTYCF